MKHVSPVAAPVTDRAYDWFVATTARLRAAQWPAWLWVVVLWALSAFPAAALRGTHYEEGTVIGLARGAVEDGHWLAPHLYGDRFVERPVLLSWIAAAISWPFGSVSVWAARLPHLLFLLAGGLTVFHLIRPLTRAPAAVFGALCWFACPMVAQKFITAEPDVTMSVLLFAAFAVWWRGSAAGPVSPQRWAVVAALLIAAELTKGPQPAAYFALGVGAYLLMRRRWRDLAGLVAVNLAAAAVVSAWYVAVAQPGDMAAWVSHSRLSDGMSASQWIRDHLDFAVSLCVEWLPGSILLGAAVVALRRGERLDDGDLLLALILYALAATAVLLVWPGGIATRYAMPANLALAAMSGLLYERWWGTRPWLIGACNTVVITIAVYLAALSTLAMPLLPDAFRQARNTALAIEAVRSARPGVLHASRETVNANVLAYVGRPVRLLSLADIAALDKPALALLSATEVGYLAERAPRRRVIVHAAVKDKNSTRIVEITPE